MKTALEMATGDSFAAAARTVFASRPHGMGSVAVGDLTPLPPPTTLPPAERAGSRTRPVETCFAAAAAVASPWFHRPRSAGVVGRCRFGSWG